MPPPISYSFIGDFGQIFVTIYVRFCMTYSVISVLPYRGVDVTTLRSGHKWPLSFDRYESTSFHLLLLAKMAMESFH